MCLQVPRLLCVSEIFTKINPFITVIYNQTSLENDSILLLCNVFDIHKTIEETGLMIPRKLNNSIA